MPKKAKRPAIHLSKNNKASKSTNSLSPDTRPLSVVGIGASAGGLEAFEQLLKALPADTGLAYVMVQHLAPRYESMLSELLAKATAMPVVEVKEGMKVQADHVYVIPPNADMSISDGRLHLSPLTPNRALRMPIDLFLRSLADVYQGRSIGVILSGTASDGTLGLQAIKAMGGVTFAQDENSAKYSAMPRSAVAAGHVDFVLPPEGIARELKRIAAHVNILAPELPPDAEDQTTRDETLTKIFLVLRHFSHVDFSYYKPGTIKRRIHRRMFLRKIDNLPAYLQFLRKNRDEVEALFNDVLINVTGFFRDADAFESLKKNAFPAIMSHRAPNAPIRMWVPGCSTGEEPYTLSMLLLEESQRRLRDWTFEILATDLNERSLAHAKNGLYGSYGTRNLSAYYREKYFSPEGEQLRVQPVVQRNVSFSRLNLSDDARMTFMKSVDMVFCCNVLIYFDLASKRRVIQHFYNNLLPHGYLFLGPSESLYGVTEEFRLVHLPGATAYVKGERSLAGKKAS